VLARLNSVLEGDCDGILYHGNFWGRWALLCNQRNSIDRCLAGHAYHLHGDCAVMPRGLNSTLPAPAVDEATDRPILVQVEQRQIAVRYLVDGVDLERAEVAPRLRELLSRRSVRQVLLKADARLDFGVIAGVVDAGQAAGADSIELLTPGFDKSPR
jgi:biopolymer transport protein ExbD